MYDVVIVGGSLAGATSAAHLARLGRSVLLLERSDTHRRKACGEGLFPRGVEELRRLGGLNDARRLGVPLAGIRFHAGSHHVEARFGAAGAVGLGIPRADLDPLLLRQARNAGVEVRTGVAVRSVLFEGTLATAVRADNEVIPARVVIGADGLGSSVRRQAGLDRPRRGDRYGVSAHVQFDGVAEAFVDVHFRNGHEIYVTPVGPHTVNVAILLNKRLLRDARGDLQRWFQRVVGEEFGPAASCGLMDAPVAAGPFAAGCRRPWRSNLVLVGDAAGFFDAISGEGMSAGLVSARYCAEAVHEFLDTHDEQPFRRYSRQRAALVRNSNLLARVTLALAARPTIAQRSIQRLSRRPAAFTRLVAISIGELPMRDLRPSDALALLLGM